ncbi:MAG: hypothetical protein KIS73_09965 [Enhydrobacter sp.]|nr:hypothetical protein [Enhydrobacter sp.]
MAVTHVLDTDICIEALRRRSAQLLRPLHEHSPEAHSHPRHAYRHAAVALGAAVVTNTMREFRRVPGLRVENWLA